MKSKLLVMMLLAGSSLFGENHFSIGIGIGVPGYWSPPPPPVVYYAPPPCPDPTYTWIEGYWYPVGARYYWHAGYWARPPYAGAYWVAPRYYGHRYYRGYWERRRWDDDDDERWEHRGRHWDHDDDHWEHRWRHHDDDDEQ